MSNHPSSLEEIRARRVALGAWWENVAWIGDEEERAFESCFADIDTLFARLESLETELAALKANSQSAPNSSQTRSTLEAELIRERSSREQAERAIGNCLSVARQFRDVAADGPDEKLMASMIYDAMVLMVPPSIPQGD